MKKKVLIIFNKILDAMEFFLATIIILVLIAVIALEVFDLITNPGQVLSAGFLNSFLTGITTLVVAVEFVKMLLHPTAFNILELLIMALSRYVVLNHHDHWAIAIGVGCIVALFFVRHLLVAKSYKEEQLEDEELMKTEM